MITVKLTPNYAGFDIQGNFDDFYELYDSISYFTGFEECENPSKEDMRLHILGFLYDLRHAYQGSRNIFSVDNNLTDEEKKYHHIKKSVKEDVIYEFFYSLPDLLLDIILFRELVKGIYKKIDDYCVEYNYAMLFYGKVIDALKDVLTKGKFMKAKKMLASSPISDKYWLKQWFMMVAIDYLNMTKEKRQKEMMHVIEAISESYLFDDFHELKKEVEKYSKENNVPINEINCGEYPDLIE